MSWIIALAALRFVTLLIFLAIRLKQLQKPGRQARASTLNDVRQ